MDQQYRGSLFGGSKAVKKEQPMFDNEKLIAIQADLLTKRYKTDCLNAKQLQEVLNIGSDNVYTLLNDDSFPVRLIGRRKVVPIILLATYLVMGGVNNN